MWEVVLHRQEVVFVDMVLGVVHPNHHKLVLLDNHIVVGRVPVDKGTRSHFVVARLLLWDQHFAVIGHLIF